MWNGEKTLHSLLVNLIDKINHVVPKKRLLVLSAYPDIDDQIVAILRFMATADATMPIAILVRDDPLKHIKTLGKLLGEIQLSVRVFRKASIQGIWAYWRASVVMYTHGVFGPLTVPSRQTTINLWHGMPIKRVWNLPRFDYLLSTSDAYSEILAEITGAPLRKVLPIGLPRNDLLFSKSTASVDFSAKLTTGADRVGMFLPTYRESDLGRACKVEHETMCETLFTAEMDDIEKLRCFLTESRTRLIVKPHPMSKYYGKVDLADNHIWFIDDAWLHEHGIGLYEALGQMEFLITDLSSVYIDYLALQRPILFYFPDIESYKATRSFIVEPMEKWLAGPLCLTVTDLVASLDELFCIGRDDYVSDRSRLGAILNPQRSAGASCAVFELMRRSHAAIPK